MFRVATIADVNLPETIDGESPLHVAIRTKNVPVFDILLSHGANLEQKTSSGRPPLWFALLEDTNLEKDSLASRLVTAGIKRKSCS